jgi:predicted nucleic acid-binding protein
MNNSVKACNLRRQQCFSEAITGALEDYLQYQIELRQTDISAQLDLALRYQLSSYAAAYLWLAADLKAPLATFDEKLGRAAQQHLASLA